MKQQNRIRLNKIMKNKMQIYRQGDVLVQRIASIPKTAIRQQPVNGLVTVAHGEVTGHHHSIDAEAADWWKSADDDSQYVAVKTPTQLTHQEHSAVSLAPGSYRIMRQREYSPAAIRNVAD